MADSQTPDFQNFSLTGKFLIAMPQMADLRFAHSVILICMHDDHGAMGVAVNQSFPGMNFEELLRELKIEVLTDAIKPEPVLLGGPMQPAHGSLIHTMDFQHDSTILINETIGFSQSLEALQQVAQGKGPKDFLFVLGYAGWGPGQLEQELQDNAWLVVDADLEILFNTQLDDRWHRALSRHGINPSMLSSEAGHA